MGVEITMRRFTVSMLFVLSLLVPTVLAASDFSMNVGVVQSYGFMYTNGMERVTPMDVVTLDGDVITVYCAGWRVSWKCHNYGQMEFIHIEGDIETNWQLSPPPTTVPTAFVVLDAYKIQG